MGWGHWTVVVRFNGKILESRVAETVRLDWTERAEAMDNEVKQAQKISQADNLIAG